MTEPLTIDDILARCASVQEVIQGHDAAFAELMRLDKKYQAARSAADEARTRAQEAMRRFDVWHAALKCIHEREMFRLQAEAN